MSFRPKLRRTTKAVPALLLFSLLAFSLSILIIAPAAARAQASGQTDIDIDLPDIVILHYFSQVQVSISSAALGNVLTGVPGDSAIDEGAVTAGPGGFTQDLGMGPSPLPGADPSAVLLTLQNAWAVRAISLAGGTDTQVSITIDDNLLDHITTAAFIQITAGAVSDGVSTGPTIQFPAPGLANPQLGDIQLTLDLSTASNAGLYEQGLFTLTAQNL
jgi:hypothetical protein